MGADQLPPPTHALIQSLQGDNMGQLNARIYCQNKCLTSQQEAELSVEVTEGYSRNMLFWV